ncbi:Integrator complex subunit 8 [Lamellibrachia satsuma]|nr:Integrator complex subunit 8 [Lamellibrachia satsuma]
MPEFDPRNHFQQPSTPTAVSWFEFLLDPSLLEKHFSEDNPVPSATELLALFLYQADLAAIAAKEQKQDGANGNGESLVISDDAAADQDCSESQKVKALKLLALKVAGYLKWDLQMLCKSVPLAMVYGILCELLKVTIPGNIDVTRHTELDVPQLPDEAIFSVQLYHRWVLQTAVMDTFPTKPSKVVNVQVPGLLNPAVAAAKGKDTVMELVKEGQPNSVAVLERFLPHTRSIHLPSMHSFGVPDEKTNAVEHDWTCGLLVSAAEITYLVCFDLGRFYFYQEDYARAKEMFLRTQHELRQVKDPVLCSVNKEQLEGYCCACGAVTAASLASTGLLARMELSKKHAFSDVVELLLEDNKRRELSLAFRASVEDDIRHANSDLYAAVLTCNMVRGTLGGSTVHPQFIPLLKSNSRCEDLLLKACTEILPSASQSEKTNLKTFLKYVCCTLTDASSVSQKLMGSSELKMLFNEDELSMLKSHLVEESVDITTTPLKNEEGVAKVAELEQLLLTTYSPTLIKQYVHKLMGKVPERQLMFLTDKWRVSRDLLKVIEGLPIPLVKICTHILVAKANICLQLKLFDTAHVLLCAADLRVRDISYKLSKLLRWEILRADLMHYQTTGHLLPDQSLQDLLKKAKTCFTSLQLEHDIKLGVGVVNACACFLLNSHEWEYLCSISNIQNGYLLFSRLLCELAKELPLLKNARKPARELWEALVLIFTSSVQQKRASTGTSSVIRRQHYL